jgi:protein-tyrosine phosphatase
MVTAGKEWVKEVMEAIAASQPGILFNCSAGKDRTGIIAALLLGIAGAYELDIVADYALTRVYLEDEMKAAGADWGVFGDAPPAAMQTLLAHFKKEYGGIIEYLHACDISSQTIEKVRTLLLD